MESFELFVDNALLFLQGWGFIIVIVFGIMHPVFENPFALFNLSLAIALLGAPIGYAVVFVSNVIGILVLYVLATKFNEKSNDILFKKKVSKSTLDWVKNTPLWKHIVVIGVPAIPTYPIKIAVPLSKVGFQKYMVTLVGAYIFLFIGNTLIYYGIAGLITNIIPNYVAILLLVLLILYIYFGKHLFNKEEQIEEVI